MRSRRSLVPRLLRSLHSQGLDVNDAATAGPGHATELAREAVARGADLVLVAGGDGTINEVANGLVHSGIPLGVLPGGTANVLATELGLRRSPFLVAEQLSSLSPRKISVGRLIATGAPPRYFLAMAGVGLDAHIVVSVDPELKKRLGKVAYWLGGFGQLGRQFPTFQVSLNGDRQSSSFTLASRVRNYGGDFEIAKTVSLLDDHFEVVSFESPDSFRYLMYLTGVLANFHHKLEGVSVHIVRRVEFSSPAETEVLVQVDGECAGRLPACVEIVPEALDLLMPATILDRYRCNGAGGRRD